MLTSAGNPSPTARRRRRDLTTQRLLEQLVREQDPHARRHLRDEVVRLNVEVALGIASQYRGRGIEYEDLRQVACLGLVKAVHAFRVEVGASFLGFARPTISGEIKRHFRDCVWMVRPPRRVQELQADVRAIETGLGRTLGRTPARAEVARAVGVPEAQVRELDGLTGCFRPVSLDAPTTSGHTVGELVEDAADEYAVVELLECLRPALASLSARERTMMGLRIQGRTQRAIGRELGLSQMEVSRQLRRIGERLHGEIFAADRATPA
jgi:RNA polymerase sigma-B factor